MTTNESIWSYADDECAETLSGRCATREEAIAEGTKEYEGAPFWVFECRMPSPTECMLDADDIVEQMATYACDNFGECAEDFPDLSAEATAELQALLDAWAEKYVRPTFWTADGCAPAERIGARVESVS